MREDTELLELAIQHRRQIREALDDLQASLVKSEEITHVRIVRSMPALGPVITGTLFGEGLITLLRTDLEMAQAYAGIAPVRVVTGKRQTHGKPLVIIRRACSRPCREAVYHAAELRMQMDDTFRKRYRPLRARGHRQGRAADSWVTGCWRNSARCSEIEHCSTRTTRSPQRHDPAHPESRAREASVRPSPARSADRS